MSFMNRFQSLKTEPEHFYFQVYIVEENMSDTIIDRIKQLSPKVGVSSHYAELLELTRALIQSYQEMGRLDSDPFEPSRLRTLDIPTSELIGKLDGSVCLVTGGLGCVGSTLIRDLLDLNVHRIVVLDNASNNTATFSPRVIYFNCDICNQELVDELFGLYQPDFVFHTAAQRDPGYAEIRPAETMRVNVMGTLNIVKACERTQSVKQFVFSSTGKASRYYTEEVYAASKKICEYIIASYAQTSNVQYSIVRFTHIVDNSLMNMGIKKACQRNDFVAIHAAGKYVTAQNVNEASSLMLNALVYVEPRSCNFLIARNLEWPVESLEVALYNIKQAGSLIPVIFTGNPSGYDEKFFRGQVNWMVPWELNHLINVYEFHHHMKHNIAGDIIISRVIPCEKKVLNHLIDNLQWVAGEHVTKNCLFRGLANVVKSMMKNVPQSLTVDVLKWGLDRKWMESEKTSVADYGPLISILVESLGNGDEYQKIQYIFDPILPDELLSTFRTASL
jgi:hypothetical protein